ncbi:hypothetical protein SERLA73DRAFT_77539 [Serpula lacrymans var. lacrymans S7.3]|uniref:Uncharacterized protein n=1 Tax=Serpula lacrymans var. lacrymans (strain S7.3) TaxID=936435 RepID=F8QAL1_SERL3|nr:hypothetical protein SERLA73DRAFT_77539 [Serpula lacrymans var. lacrymans S7.3]
MSSSSSFSVPTKVSSSRGRNVAMKKLQRVIKQSSGTTTAMCREREEYVYGYVKFIHFHLFGVV